jgi:hypothetical protein
MPLDMITNTITADELLPENLNFGISFETTKFNKKKYVINEATGEYLGVVGADFTCADHRTFFTDIYNNTTEKLGADQCADMKINFSTAHNNAWALMDMTLPNVKAKITTPKHETEVAQRIIALHGIDGTASNTVFYGAIDFFCTNGMVRGEHDKVRRKNSSGFSMDNFIHSLDKSKKDFDEQSERLQSWADKSLEAVNVKDKLDTILQSDTKAEKMFTLYNQEVSVRGRNVFSLYSAFTNYATYADERNGFTMRNTGFDTEAKTMFSREHEVSKWIATPTFKQLVAA